MSFLSSLRYGVLYVALCYLGTCKQQRSHFASRGKGSCGQQLIKLIFCIKLPKAAKVRGNTLRSPQRRSAPLPQLKDMHPHSSEERPLMVPVNWMLEKIDLPPGPSLQRKCWRADTREGTGSDPSHSRTLFRPSQLGCGVRTKTVRCSKYPNPWKIAVTLLDRNCARSVSRILRTKPLKCISHAGSYILVSVSRCKKCCFQRRMTSMAACV